MFGVKGLFRTILKGRPDGWRAQAFAGAAPPESAPLPVQDTQPSAPQLAGLRDLGDLSGLAPGQVTEIALGAHVVAVANVHGTLHAVDGVCPHVGGPLGCGSLEGHLLTCPTHGWTYDVRTGMCSLEGESSVEVYALVERDGRVFVRI